MKRTSPESTNGLVVNHSQRKTEAEVSQVKGDYLLSPELTESRKGLNWPFTKISLDGSYGDELKHTFELWQVIACPALVHAKHTGHDLRSTA
jgi:hypothetical protein